MLTTAHYSRFSTPLKVTVALLFFFQNRKGKNLVGARVIFTYFPTTGKCLSMRTQMDRYLWYQQPAGQTAVVQVQS